MSDQKYRLDTEEQRERFHAARRHGEVCAACGKAFEQGDVIYIERFGISPTGTRPASAWAPVGRECASPELLERTQNQEPEQCAGCGRGVYYDATRGDRVRALCSLRCTKRADIARDARRATGKEPAG
jgi:hypothetical protein